MAAIRISTKSKYQFESIFNFNVYLNIVDPGKKVAFVLTPWHHH